MLWLPTTRLGEGNDFAMLRLGVAIEDTIAGDEAQLFVGLQLAPGAGAFAPPVESTDA